MGKRMWKRELDESEDKQQPGCMPGLVNVLDYHHWHSNFWKMIQLRKYQDQTRDKHSVSAGHWSPKSKMYRPDGDEAEKLLAEQESTPYLSTKRSRAMKKRSLRPQLKASSADEGENGSISSKPSLQRTYSIHHRKSLDEYDDNGTIHTDPNNPIIFFPATQTNNDPSNQGPDDVLEIFKVDKELLMKHLQHGDKRVGDNFSNTKAKFRKSRSFPVSERVKAKPVKLENKQREVWSFPKVKRFQADEIDVGKYIYQRSCSSNESLDKNAHLFYNSFRRDAKLSVSKSLKLTNEYGNAPLYLRRIRSLSNVELFGDGPSGNGWVVNVKDGNDYSDKENLPLVSNMHMQENNASLTLRDSDDDCEKEKDSYCSDHRFALDLNNSVSQETESRAVHHQISQGLDHRSSTHDTKFLIDPNDPKSLPDSELHYVRHLLNRSGIAVDASEIKWHSSDQLFSPQLFEEVEACWRHKQHRLDHQMLFDLVNEVLVEMYDLCLPYYPNPLSSSCHVRPFPVGNHIVESVCKSIGTLLNLKTHEKQSLECIVGRDYLARDYSWMNLQLETESVALDLEDMIFNELLEEVLFS